MDSFAKSNTPNILHRPDNRLPAFINTTFGHERGFQNDKNDKGNYYGGILFGTIYGITARDHFDDFYEVYNLWAIGKKDEAKQLAAKFYAKSDYWNLKYNFIIDSSLAFKIWDTGINAGVRTAVKILQKTINQNGMNIKKDGLFGNVTLTCVNTLSIPESETIETEFYYNYLKNLETYYRSLWNFFRFGKGWIKRIRTVFNGTPNLYNSLKK